MAADSTVRTFDPKQVVITFGTVIFTGYAEGEVVTIERNGDAFTGTKGADGGIDRVNNNNNMFEIEVNLKQTSPTNAELSALLTADQLGNAGVLPLSVADLSGNSIFVAAQAWIKNSPDVSYGDTMSNRTWVFETGIAAFYDAGN